jgi:glutaredoxin 3
VEDAVGLAVAKGPQDDRLGLELTGHSYTQAFMSDANGNKDAVSKVVMYTTDPCGFCRQAKALLQSRGIEYEEIDLARSPEGREALVARTGQMTFPQILVGERSIGGFRELVEADRDGLLQSLLAA